ncbi:MAG: hypothetical protein IPI19_16845 [Ignavibacteriales bacterium]|nr:hypothetical protein [Ignavibacteriales bacterium]
MFIVFFSFPIVGLITIIIDKPFTFSGELQENYRNLNNLIPSIWTCLIYFTALISNLIMSMHLKDKYNQLLEKINININTTKSAYSFDLNIEKYNILKEIDYQNKLGEKDIVSIVFSLGYEFSNENSINTLTEKLPQIINSNNEERINKKITKDNLNIESLVLVDNICSLIKSGFLELKENELKLSSSR